jgi:NAD(P)-dependent dehydrogenase (short-subunit alcohol dehydrogenase family)
MKTLDQFDIKGRSALVTGAASGIGADYLDTLIR